MGNDESALDWNERWKRAAAHRWQRAEQPSHLWNRRAATFGERATDSAYARAFLSVMAPEAHWSVLDVGCGTGNLALPLARQVRQVTAMDFSEGMLERLSQRALAQGVPNLRILHAAWEDDWERAGVGTHDVAIASRSLVAVGRPFRKGPDYLYVYNLLHQLGIYANIAMLATDPAGTFGTPEEARDHYELTLQDLDAGERSRLHAYLARDLVPQDGRWMLRNRAPIQWAMIWWVKATAPAGPEGTRPVPG